MGGAALLGVLVLYFLAMFFRMQKRERAACAEAEVLPVRGSRLMRGLILLARLCLWLMLAISASTFTVWTTLMFARDDKGAWGWSVGSFVVMVAVFYVDRLARAEEVRLNSRGEEVRRGFEVVMPAERREGGE